MPSPIYRIRDWEELYEPVGLRLAPRDAMKWIAVPTKQDGAGYCQLVTQKHGAAFFGAWIAMVQIAGKCFPRGVLIRQNGRPHDHLSLSLQSKLPSVLFERVLPYFVDELCWLETIDGLKLADLAERARMLTYTRTRDRADSDNTEQNNTTPNRITKARAKSGATPRRVLRPVDDDYIAELQANPAYAKLNVEIIYHQMVAWCKPRQKAPSRRRLVNFCNNRLEDVMAGESNETNRVRNSGSNSGRQTASEKRTGKLAGRDYSGLARGTVERDELKDDETT